MKKISIIAITAIICSAIIGWSLYAIQVNKQNIIEKQRNIDLQANIQAGQTRVAQEEYQIKSEEFIASQKVETENIKNDSTICNGISWSNCPLGQKFYCPPSGNAVCMPPQSENAKNDGILCNGVLWAGCQEGEFHCPPSGNPTCESPKKECLDKGIAMITEANKEQQQKIEDSGITNINDKMRLNLELMTRFNNSLYFVQLTCGTVTKEDQLIHALEQITDSINNLTR